MELMVFITCVSDIHDLKVLCMYRDSETKVNSIFMPLLIGFGVGSDYKLLSGAVKKLSLSYDNLF